MDRWMHWLLIVLTVIGFIFMEPARAADAPRVSVGVIVSKATAERKIDAGPVDYDRMLRVLSEIRDDGFDFCFIVDPGTARDAKVLEACHAALPKAPLIDGADAAAIARLDVIVASHILVIDPKMLDSIEAAVRGGTGLFTRMFFFSANPADGDRMRHLAGLAAPGEVTANEMKDPPASGQPADYSGYARTGTVNCRVMAEHPILGGLLPDDMIEFAANGEYGRYLESPLIVVDDPRQIRSNAAGRPVAVLYTSRLGKGTIVTAPFSGSRAVPSKLDRAATEKFGIRTVRWLAEQKRVNANLPPAPEPATRPAYAAAPTTAP